MFLHCHKSNNYTNTCIHLVVGNTCQLSNIYVNYGYVKTVEKSWAHRHNNLFAVDFLKNLEDFYEEVDDVEIKLDGGNDIFLGRDPLHNHLCVKNDKK